MIHKIQGTWNPPDKPLSSPKVRFLSPKVHVDYVVAVTVSPINATSADVPRAIDCLSQDPSFKLMLTTSGRYRACDPMYLAWTSSRSARTDPLSVEKKLYFLKRSSSED